MHIHCNYNKNKVVVLLPFLALKWIMHMLHRKEQFLSLKRAFCHIVVSDTSQCAHCSVHSTKGAKIKSEMQQSLQFLCICNPLDILHLQTESIGQTLSSVLNTERSRGFRDGSFTTVQPICAFPNAHIYFVSRAFASFSHELLPF